MASIFLDCFKNTGKDYIRVVEGYYFKKPDGKATVRRRTIKNLGPLEKFDDNLGDGLIYRLREKFKNQELDIGMPYEELGLNPRTPKISNIEKNLILKNMGYFFIESIYNKLGITQILSAYKSNSKLQYDLIGLTKLLVYGRILDPKSKKATFANGDEYLYSLIDPSTEKDIYKTLDILDKKSNAIQKRIDSKIMQSSINRKRDLMYYDVTNYYFETMYGDDDEYELDVDGNVVLDKNNKPVILKKGTRKKGVSKENRNQPLVAMGLLIDNNGLPVSYKIHPGNMQDKTTFKEHLLEHVNQLDCDKVIVVADNGVYAQENMYLLSSEGNGYIISKSVKKHWNTKPTESEKISLKDWALNDEGYTYTTDSNNENKFKFKSRIYEKSLKDSNGNEKTIKEKQVIFWSKKHYDRELKQNLKFIEYLESCKENPDKLKDKQRKSQEFIKVLQTNKNTGEVIKTKPLVILLEDKIEKYKETMGYYSIVTSEVNLKDEEIINRYRGLSRIEDSFRVMKSDLKARPIFVKTDEHINAHFLICFIALLIVRIIQHKVLIYQKQPVLNTDGWTQGITAKKLQEELKNYNATHIGDGYYQTTPDTETIKLIKKALYINSEISLPSLNQIKSYKNEISRFKL